ncbi:ATP-dependent sacrificial sulfur transferase LarE [Halanaerocella petrolearia]
MNLEEKYEELQRIIKELGNVIIGFSGGVDSTLLSKVSYDLLGDKALAVTAKAPIYSIREIKQAKKVAKEIGINHKVAEIDAELMDRVTDNPSDRCYLCKSKIFSQVKELANTEQQVVDGTNVDDLDDYRPGMKAIKELEVRSPLKEAQLNKDEIRKLSKKLGLSTWDDPSFTCLATRFPYGEKITREKIERAEEAELYLMDEFGFEQLRVRYHDGEMARIEVTPEERKKFFELGLMDEVSQKLKEIGFNYVALDLAGYRTGSMNEAIDK